jgi:cysteine-S-conjugate beta-lyase
MQEQANSQFDIRVERKNTNCLQYDALDRVFGAKDVLPMWVADMGFRAPQPVLDALSQRIEHGVFGYGLKSESWFQSITDWMSKRHQWPIKNEWISFCPGVVPSFNIIVEVFTRPGDGIIIQPPVYPPFFDAVTKRNRELLTNPLRKTDKGYEIDFDDFKIKARNAKMFILCNPHNPVGRVWTKNELEKLASICLENDVLIVSDEIHSDLVFKPHKHNPLASLSPEVADKTITCMAPSKTFNLAGLASSVTIASNEKLRKGFQQWLASFHLDGGNVPGVIALETAYRYGEPWLEELLTYIEANFDVFREGLSCRIPQLSMDKPQATYLGWVDFSKLNLNSKELKKLVIEEAKLGFNSGAVFGEGGEQFMRVNFANQRSIVYEALDRLERALK